MINTDKTYLVHYTKLEDRKKQVDQQFKHFGIDFECISQFDQEDLTDELLQKHYDSSEESYNSKIHPTYGNGSTPHRILSRGEISCVFKHKVAIQKIAKECDNYGVVFEDDAVFVEDFVEKFNQFLDSTPDDWDAIFIGSCAGLRIAPQFLKENVYAYKVNHPASKGTDSYLLKRDLAEKISVTMDKFVTAADWELSYQLKLHNANVYWWEPPLVAQGSEIGLYKSELR